MKTTCAKAILSLLGLFMITGCTKTAIERQVGSENTYSVTGTAACLGLCAPDRDEVYQAMHQECRWPAVPAILVRGSAKNGLLGVPHTVWRFTCLSVDTETNIAELIADDDYTDGD
ncbi:hypothetical protein CKO28_22680 [Rhodovibrio sodomensis]|uniref:Lipoprotein n=1 Tax=Rhodovibrio sodomensis TaxID=1088 RepID=A0ABS1DK35_9PROT|nr:hypothetical protein [Rhodovibrio sodomensis]MBK1670827.1 hypothetical protein [Rhodovibrio sodomensis]